MKRNLKQRAISLLLMCCIFFTNIGSVFASGVQANPLISEMMIPNVLKSAQEINILENSDTVTAGEVIFEDFKVTVEWNRMSNEVVMTEEFFNPKTRSIDKTVRNEFDVEIGIEEDGFYFTGDVNYNNSTYNAEELTSVINSDQAPYTVLGVVIGWGLLDILINLGYTITVSGMVYALYKEITAEIEANKKQYKSYRALISSRPDGKSDLFIGDPFVSALDAGVWMRKGEIFGVYSVDQIQAFKVAQEAGLGMSPVGPEHHNDKPGIHYYHYHAFARKGGHSWWGQPILAR